MSLSRIVWLLLPVIVQATEVDTAIKTQKEHLKSAQNSQHHIDAVTAQKAELLQEYRQLAKELKQQEAYNAHLRTVIHSQEKRVPELTMQINDIDRMQGNLLPLMFEMTQTLETFLNIDTPFLLSERKSRLANIKKRLAEPDLTMADQFRSIFDAYKIEYQYARTLESYRGTLNDEHNRSRTVDFLRLGRVALYYQTLDHHECGVYDATTQQWSLLQPHYNKAIGNAIKIARKKSSPDFLFLPLLRQKVSQ